MTVQKNLDFPWSMEDTIENLKELKEILQEHLRHKNYEGQGERNVKEIALDFDRAIQALEEVEQYRALGTVEELKEAMEYQTTKKPTKRKLFEDSIMEYWSCETCKSIISINQPYCDRCGQAIDWSEEDV